MPFALKEAIELGLDWLEREGIIEKVPHSQWATPVVPVPKPNGHIRFCGDYKLTLNPCFVVDQYPLPKQDELFATLAGGQRFTKIDLTNAYQQLMPPKSWSLHINTHKGLFKYNRLPFGAASAPTVFQQVMDTSLKRLDLLLG